MSKRTLIAAISCAALVLLGVAAWTLRSKDEASSAQSASAAKEQGTQGQGVAPEQDNSKMTTEQVPVPQRQGFVPPPSIATGESPARKTTKD